MGVTGTWIRVESWVHGMTESKAGNLIRESVSICYMAAGAVKPRRLGIDWKVRDLP